MRAWKIDKNLPLIECVPNVSEGRDISVIDALTESIEQVKGVELLHRDIGAGANRTVFTFAGQPNEVCEAAFQLAYSCKDLIDMRTQEGAHPRIGSFDVCPLVPLKNISLSDTALWATKLGRRIGAELEIPVYYYEANAQKTERSLLAQHRRGGYEGLSSRIPVWPPDDGPLEFRAQTGGSVIGARPFLLAFNISLKTNDISRVKTIASRIRESGKLGPDGKREKGMFAGLRSIAWFMPEYGECQVSMNITRPWIHTLPEIYAAVERLALGLEIEVSGSELIGMLPKQALLNGFLKVGMSEREAVGLAVDRLKLRAVHDFEPNERILEYALGTEEEFELKLEDFDY